MENDWVHIKDGLPKVGIPVLLYDGSCEVEIGALSRCHHGDEAFEWWIQNVGIIGLGWYTYWMPVPKLPKGE